MSKDLPKPTVEYKAKPKMPGQGRSVPRQQLKHDAIRAMADMGMKKGQQCADLPEALESLIRNTIMKAELISRLTIPTDREMKSVQIALELLVHAPKLGEALAKDKPFAPVLTAALEEGTNQRQVIDRLRLLVAKAKDSPEESK